jgi:putative flavoprotein involved in K+ transport
MVSSMTETHLNTSYSHPVIIVGAGPAGIGLGALFKQLGFDDFIIIDRHEIGSTFKKWPKEMKLLTPSFPGHGFGLLDMNAVVPSTSPGYVYASEHLTGSDYADYLKKVAEHFQLPVKKGVEVKELEKEDNEFILETDKGPLRSEFVVWAGGEFQYPSLHSFKGSENCLHTSMVDTWRAFEQEHYYIIGGYESGMDAAIHLARNGKKVTVLSKGAPWEENDPDPSVSLSPFTSQRLSELSEKQLIDFKGHSEIVRVEFKEEEYLIHLSSGEILTSGTRPFMATGFKSSLSCILEHFYWEDNGDIRLTEQDESTVSDGLFLTGPQVKHKDVIFCFIYKFRQRFAVLADEICTRLGFPFNDAVLTHYRQANMYLDDLSCCDNSCEC